MLFSATAAGLGPLRAGRRGLRGPRWRTARSTLTDRTSSSCRRSTPTGGGGLHRLRRPLPATRCSAFMWSTSGAPRLLSAGSTATSSDPRSTWDKAEDPLHLRRPGITVSVYLHRLPGLAGKTCQGRDEGLDWRLVLQRRRRLLALAQRRPRPGRGWDGWPATWSPSTSPGENRALTALDDDLLLQRRLSRPEDVVAVAHDGRARELADEAVGFEPATLILGWAAAPRATCACSTSRRQVGGRAVAILYTVRAARPPGEEFATSSTTPTRRRLSTT